MQILVDPCAIRDLELFWIAGTPHKHSLPTYKTLSSKR